jgi:hypothetical protein
MFSPKAAEINYILSLQISDEESQGHTITRRKMEQTYKHELYNESFDAKIATDYAQRIAAIEEIDPEKFKTEQALFEALFKDFFENPDSETDPVMLLHDVCHYVQASDLFNENDKLPLVHFLLNSKKSAGAFARFNESGAANKGAQSINASLKSLKADLKAIWGNEISFRNDSAEKMAADFENFDKILDELEAKAEPISAKAKVKYKLDVKKLKLLPRKDNALLRYLGLSKGQKLLSGEVEYWQLPTRLLEIREYLGLAAKNSPAFRLVLDARTPDLKAAFRISANGDTLDELKAAIDEKLSEKMKDYPSQSLNYAFTLASHAPTQQPFLAQTPIFEKLEDLHADLQDTLLTLSMSGYERQIPKLR